MSHLQVLVVSSAHDTGDWLTARLPADRYEIRTARPGAGLVRAVRERRPDVAVVEGIHDRPGVAPLEVALLKDRSPAVLIIALSDRSSERDAEVVEQGIFCYLAGRSREELLRVVQAAAREEVREHPLPCGP
jgi:DNA-binding response OmpR family regulator